MQKIVYFCKLYYLFYLIDFKKLTFRQIGYIIRHEVSSHVAVLLYVGDIQGMVLLPAWGCNVAQMHNSMKLQIYCS
jgi:hypothetical protein